jgi:type IV fimbrial biogenesis protein FimT
MLRQNESGLTLIEVMITIVIFASLLGLAAPSFSTWIQIGHVRTAAEGILNGLQLARATAVQRNATVNFQLVTTLTAACAVSTAGPSWVVSRDDPTGACTTAPSETTAPRIVQSRSGSEGSRNAVIAADQASIGFNGLGRRINAGSANNVNINVTNTTGGTCVAAGGDVRCLRVMVSSSGQVRMCDPSVASTDTRGC